MFAATPLENSHKHVQHGVRHNSSLGGGKRTAGVHTGFNEPAKQQLRRQQKHNAAYDNHRLLSLQGQGELQVVEGSTLVELLESELIDVAGLRELCRRGAVSGDMMRKLQEANALQDCEGDDGHGDSDNGGDDGAANVGASTAGDGDCGSGGSPHAGSGRSSGVGGDGGGSISQQRESDNEHGCDDSGMHISPTAHSCGGSSGGSRGGDGGSSAARSVGSSEHKLGRGGRHTTSVAGEGADDQPLSIAEEWAEEQQHMPLDLQGSRLQQMAAGIAQRRIDASDGGCSSSDAEQTSEAYSEYSDHSVRCDESESGRDSM